MCSITFYVDITCTCFLNVDYYNINCLLILSLHDNTFLRKNNLKRKPTNCSYLHDTNQTASEPIVLDQLIFWRTQVKTNFVKKILLSGLQVIRAERLNLEILDHEDY